MSEPVAMIIINPVTKDSNMSGGRVDLIKVINKLPPPSPSAIFRTVVTAMAMIRIQTKQSIAIRVSTPLPHAF